MSDLISRSAVLKQLEKWKKNWENTEDSYEKTWTLTCIDFYTRLITNQPTAYDVEKVVAELEEKSDDIPVQYEENYDKGFDDGIWYAIDIVKRGGVE